ncbi:MAG: hypothetical protein Q4E76_01385 [Tissierellia bacterium]|nr:hypothetical protein [Tissierellia bacterium]
MNLLEKLYPEHSRVSIIGMSKNSGKTFTLNALMAEAEEMGLTMGITSIGRDGERVDVLTETEKPTVYLPAESLVATTTKLMELSEATMAIQEVTPFATPLGPVVLAKVMYGGNVQVSGPQTLRDMAHILDALQGYGAQVVLVDGALDRKSQAAPELTSATILATGAAYHRSMERVVEDTAHVAKLFALPELPEFQPLLEEHTLAVMDRKGAVTEIPVATSLMAGRRLAEVVGEDTAYILVSGALVGSVVETLMQHSKPSSYTIVVKDPTKIFIDSKSYRRFTIRGLNLAVAHASKLVAITANPYAPEGYQFESGRFLRALKERIEDVPIVDLMRGQG